MTDNHAQELQEAQQVQMEEVSELIKQIEVTQAPPIFELYAALVSISISVLMFWIPELLAASGPVHGYMTLISPQAGWAGLFLVSGLISATGMLVNSKLLRIVALLLMGILYSILTSIYIILFPNFGCALMGWLTIFTFSSIPLVKRTGLKK